MCNNSNKNVIPYFVYTRMNPLCKELGFPHKGWKLENVIDLGEDCFSSDEIVYENCEFCGHEQIRYVHIISHPDYNRCVRVGCDCAEQLTTDYDNPKKREDELRRKANRRKNFLKQEWKETTNGNYTLKYKGERVTIKCGRYSWSVVLNGTWVNKYKGKPFFDFETACFAAFELFDSRTRG